MNSISLTRAELYTLVWSEPLSALAERSSLSEYALRKICIDLSIPLPRAGHWKQVQAGDSTIIPPLPQIAGKQQTVTLSFRATQPIAGPFAID